MAALKAEAEIPASIESLLSAGANAEMAAAARQRHVDAVAEAERCAAAAAFNGRPRAEAVQMPTYQEAVQAAALKAQEALAARSSAATPARQNAAGAAADGASVADAAAASTSAAAAAVGSPHTLKEERTVGLPHSVVSDE